MVYNLIFSGYSDKAVNGDNPHIIGKIDKDRFSRNEKYEVLELIKNYLEKNKLHEKIDAVKVEFLIHEYLPKETQMRNDVILWLEKNWNNFNNDFKYFCLSHRLE